HDLAREFQTSHKAHDKRDVKRGMKVITRWRLMRLKGRRMSQMISLYKVIHLPQKKNCRILGGIRTHDLLAQHTTDYATEGMLAWLGKGSVVMRTRPLCDPSMRSE
ncbi:MAG: hypothetical protein PV344_05085, partial [Anaplasma sp.]|nr:hypothetical protein [Anaplasma sp.]